MKSGGGGGGGGGGKGGDSSHLGQPAVFYNGQRYSRIKEPTKTVLGRSERRLPKELDEILAT